MIKRIVGMTAGQFPMKEVNCLQIESEYEIMDQISLSSTKKQIT